MKPPTLLGFLVAGLVLYTGSAFSSAIRGRVGGGQRGGGRHAACFAPPGSPPLTRSGAGRGGDEASREEDRRRKAELYEAEKAAIRAKEEEAAAEQAKLEAKLEAERAERAAEREAARQAGDGGDGSGGGGGSGGGDDDGVMFDPRVSPHLQGAAQGSVGVIVVDHGSKREAANAQLAEVVAAVKKHSGRAIVEPAHMELAAPSIADAYASCVAQGATSIVCHPFFLSPGRHVTEDVPALLAEAAEPFQPDVPYVLTLPLGASDLIPGLIAESVDTTLRFYPPSAGGIGGGAAGDPSQLGFIGEVMRMAEAAAAETAAEKAAAEEAAGGGGASAPAAPAAPEQDFVFDPRASPLEQ